MFTAQSKLCFVQRKWQFDNYCKTICITAQPKIKAKVKLEKNVQ